MLSMFDKIFFLAAQSFGKLSLIVYSMVLSSHFGEESISSFVLLLNTGALLSSVAALGVSPQILRAQNVVEGWILNTIIAGAILLSISFLCYFIFIVVGKMTSSASFDILNFIMVCLYSIGLYISSVILALLNRSLQYAKSGALTLTVYLGPLLAGCIVIVLAFDSTHAVAVYFVVYFFLVFVLGVFFSRNLISYIGLHQQNFRSMCSNFIWPSLKVSVFGIVTLLGIFLLNHYVVNNAGEDEGALFAMSFQLFSISIYLPGIFAAIIIPKLSQNKIESGRLSFDLKIMGVYIFVPFSLLVLFKVAGLYILDLYSVKGSSYNLETVYIFLYASVIASLNAFFIQKCIVSGDYKKANVVSFVWLLSLLVSMYWLEVEGAKGSAGSLLFAYILSCGCYFVFGIAKSRTLQR